MQGVGVGRASRRPVSACAAGAACTSPPDASRGRRGGVSRKGGRELPHATFFCLSWRIQVLGGGRFVLLRIPPRLNVRFGLIALGCIGGHGGSGPGSAEGGPLSPPPRPPALRSHALTAKPRQASGSVAKLLLQLRTRPGDASHLRQLDKRREEGGGAGSQRGRRGRPRAGRQHRLRRRRRPVQSPRREGPATWLQSR